MIIRVRVNDIEGSGGKKESTKWTLYSVPGYYSLKMIFDKIHCQELKPHINLDWADVDSCEYLIAVTTKDLPKTEELLETSGELTLDDLHESNHRLFLQFNLEQFKEKLKSPAKNVSDETFVDLTLTASSAAKTSVAKPSIFEVLMKKKNHFPKEKLYDKMTRDIKQYNAIVQYIKQSGFGVNLEVLKDFENFVKLFSRLLWEIDPHYVKLKSRGKSFPKIVEERFLSFNRPEDYKSKAKNISKNSISSKVNDLKDYLDRKFMASSHMKNLHETISSVLDKIVDYFEILEKQRERTFHNSNQDCVSEKDENLSDFIVTNLKMKAAMSNLYPDSFKKVKNALLKEDVYHPIELGSILEIGVSHKLRTQHYRFMKDFMENGLPFVIPEVYVYHFKLPSQGPHRALHFVWKQPITDEKSNPNQTKLILEIRSKKEVYYTRSMKRDIKQKLSKLGIVKPNQAAYIMQDLLGDKSAANDENQREILDRLHIVISAGDDIVVDLRKNNGAKPKYEEFWSVVAEYIENKTAINDRRHSTCTYAKTSEPKSSTESRLTGRSSPSTSKQPDKAIDTTDISMPNTIPTSVINSGNDEELSTVVSMRGDDVESTSVIDSTTPIHFDLLSSVSDISTDKTVIFEDTSAPEKISTHEIVDVPDDMMNLDSPTTAPVPKSVTETSSAPESTGNLENPINFENIAISESAGDSLSVGGVGMSKEGKNDEVVVNMALALSYADLFRTCEKIAKEKGIHSIPSYKWFMLQFWPTHRSASNLLHYTGRFRVRRVVQARMLRKANPDAQYARTVYGFLKERAMKYSQDTIFMSADAKCKVSIGEPGFPLAAVTRGKKVIVGSNEVFRVADHDFSKLSIIPDAFLIHEIPQRSEEVQESKTDTFVNSRANKGDWYAGSVYYSFKSMVLEGSTALRGVVEMGKVLEEHLSEGNSLPNRFNLITDGGGDRNITHLSVKKALVVFFRKYDFDEVIAIRTAAGLSFYNPVERMHARANQGLQGIGIMRRSMEKDLEILLKRCNSNEEVRKACEKEPRLSVALTASLKPTIDLLKETFLRLSMTRTEFKLYEPASEEEFQALVNLYDVFDGRIDKLTKKIDLDKFPIFKKFLETHTSSRTYSFHVFKCSDDCIFHKPLRGPTPEPFPDPVPGTNHDDSSPYVEGNDPGEIHLPSKHDDVSKQNHNIPFSPSAQTSKNVGFTIKCNECGKTRLLYSKKVIKKDQVNAFKRFMNDYVYHCGGSFREIMLNEDNRDTEVIKQVFVRENLSCSSNIELPYYSVGIYPNICIYCGGQDHLDKRVNIYPKCRSCFGKSDILRKKRKVIMEEELKGGKRQKK